MRIPCPGIGVERGQQWFFIIIIRTVNGEVLMLLNCPLSGFRATTRPTRALFPSFPLSPLFPSLSHSPCSSLRTSNSQTRFLGLTTRSPSDRAIDHLPPLHSFWRISSCRCLPVGCHAHSTPVGESVEKEGKRKSGIRVKRRRKEKRKKKRERNKK